MNLSNIQENWFSLTEVFWCCNKNENLNSGNIWRSVADKLNIVIKVEISSDWIKESYDWSFCAGENFWKKNQLIFQN